MKDLKTENFLKANGYGFVFVEALAFAQIDLKEADANPARMTKKLDQDRAISYGLAMTDGADFPAIVTLDVGEGRLHLLMTGRHRIAGAIAADINRMDAYVVREADPFRVELLLRTINNIEGRAPDQQEKLHHIVELRRLYPDVPIPELASRFGIKPHTVQSYLRDIDVEERAHRLGVGMEISLEKFRGLRQALFGLANDIVFVEIVRLIARYHDMRTGAAVSLIKELKDKTTEKQALRLIEERNKELGQIEAENRNKRSKTPKSKGTSFLSRPRGMVKAYPGSPEKLYLGGFTAAELRGERKMLDDAMTILEEVKAAMDKLIEEKERANEWRGVRSGATNYGGISPSM
jgi:hypothetical protein